MSAAGPDGVWPTTAAPAPECPPLAGEVEADVAIVGAGFTGLSAALHLAETGARAVVVEANGIGFGGSGRNVGLVNPGLWVLPDQVEALLGREAGGRLNDALIAAPALVFALIERHGIACDLQRARTLFMAHSAGGVEELKRRRDQLERRGGSVTVHDAEAVAELTGTRLYHGALHDARAGTVNPLGYARGLARAALKAGAAIHCGNRVTALARDGSRWRLTLSGGTVTADSVILATNGYTDGLWPGLKDTVMPVHFYQLASAPLSDNVARRVLPQGHGTWDTRPVMWAFRKDRDGRFLLGSVGHLGSGRFVRRWAASAWKKLYPDLPEPEWREAWAGRIAFTPEHLPRFHELGPGLITTIGYNGRGIGPGTVFGRAMAQRLLGQADAMPLDPSPVRPVPAGAVRAAIMDRGAHLDHVRQWLI